MGCFLLDTGDGLALIDCAMPQTLYQVLENIRALGFRPADIRTLFISHGHYDHAGAAEAVKQLTHCETWMGEEDMCFIGNPTLKLATDETAPDFTVDRHYHDDEPIRMGRFTIRTVHTPGHTPGARSFFFHDTADGRDVLCGMHGGFGFGTMKDEFLLKAGLPLSLKQDFVDIMKVLRDIPVTLTIGSHPAHAKMLQKLEGATPGINPFVSDTFWREMIDERLAAFLQEHPEVRA